MLESLGVIEEALTTVQKTLDTLTARGDNEAAFDLARVQYMASIRDSWPGNLGRLVMAIEEVAADDKLKLNAVERAELAKAAQQLRSVTDR